jgi:hypothetical protein
MTEAEFWDVVEAARTGGRTGASLPYAQQLEGLARVLRGLPPEEMISFRDHFMDRVVESYRWDLWGMVAAIAGGCSDDGFSDFQSWLISLGREDFAKALDNPQEIMALAARPGVESIFFEEFRYVPYDVYENATGKAMPRSSHRLPKSPAGKKWSEDQKRAMSEVWKDRRAKARAEAGPGDS